jgi:hypothetical protein
MVLHRTASSEPEPSLGEIMARLLSVERENAEIKKESAKIEKEITEQKYKVAELETELSTMRRASMSSFVIVLFLSYSSLLIHRIELRSTKSANASCSTWPATN